MKRIIALLISIAIMATIFLKIDFELFSQYLKELRLFPFFLALLCFIPQIVISALRWKYMVRHTSTISFFESLKLILSASSLNIFLPSKMGDLCKAYFLKQEGKMTLKTWSELSRF